MPAHVYRLHWFGSFFLPYVLRLNTNFSVTKLRFINTVIHAINSGESSVNPSRWTYLCASEHSFNTVFSMDKLWYQYTSIKEQAIKKRFPKLSLLLSLSRFASLPTSLALCWEMHVSWLGCTCVFPCETPLFNNNQCMFVTVIDLANPVSTEDYRSQNNRTNLSDSYLNRVNS